MMARLEPEVILTEEHGVRWRLDNVLNMMNVLACIGCLNLIALVALIFLVAS